MKSLLDLFGLRILWLYYKRTYYELALANIDPASEDVPYIVLRLASINDELRIAHGC